MAPSYAPMLTRWDSGATAVGLDHAGGRFAQCGCDTGTGCRMGREALCQARLRASMASVCQRPDTQRASLVSSIETGAVLSWRAERR